MKKIISKTITILAIIFLSVSICGISSVNCLKAYCPLKNTIILNESIMHSLNIGDISSLPYNLVPLFYIALVLITLAGIICIEKSNKIKSLMFAIIPLFLAAYVLISHNYIGFMVLTNIYFLLYILSDFALNNKIKITTYIISIMVVVINFVQLVSRLNIQFDINDFSIFEEKLITSSNLILKALLLWIIPYLILLIDDIVKICNKKSKS